MQELRERCASGEDLQVLDVRTPEEWESGHIPGARHVFAPELRERDPGLDPERPVAVYCGTGYRASVAASLLERKGFRHVHNVPGSITAWEKAGYPLHRLDDA